MKESTDPDSFAPAIDAARAAAAVDSVEFAGVPGASAQRKFDHLHTARENRVRAAHPIIGGALLALSDDPQTTKAWSAGARGEEKLGARLDALHDRGVRMLHDRRIRGTKANIDHIAIAATGVYVIDAKRYLNKRPILRVEGGILRARVEKLIVGGRDQTKLVEAAHKQVRLVRAALDAAHLESVPVSGMLCFVDGDWPVFGGDFTVQNVAVVWPKKAANLLSRPGQIEGDAIAAIHSALASGFPPA